MIVTQALCKHEAQDLIDVTYVIFLLKYLGILPLKLQLRSTLFIFCKFCLSKYKPSSSMQWFY